MQRFVDYNALKTALNMLTVQVYEDLRDTSIMVDSMSLGLIRADQTSAHDANTCENRARTSVRRVLDGEGSSSFVKGAGHTS